MSEASEAFEIPIHVQPADIDELGHVNNIVYLRWVQEAAVAHWRAIAPAADQAKLQWIVASPRDRLPPACPSGRAMSSRAPGWAAPPASSSSGTPKSFAPATGGLLAKALTIWCPIDARSGRPAAVSPEVRAIFQ